MATVRTEFPHKVRVVDNLWIPLSDGRRLAAKMWLPEDAERNPVPAILEYIPYRKRDRQALEDQRVHGYFAGHGYAAIRLDIRGSGDSEGVLMDEYLKQEQDDGVEAIAWIASQPWCTGKVGQMGISWGGFNSLQVAARRPPALKAIITVASTDDRYADDMHYMGGCPVMDTMGWGATFFGYLPTPPDPALHGEKWRALWQERLDAVHPPAITWLQHQTRDAYWKQGSVCEDYGAIQAAVYAVGGWADGYSNAIPRLMQHLKCPKKALIGPWGHCFPYEAGPGPLINFLGECLRWWDHWLKGKQNGIMDEPAITAWMQEAEPPRAYCPERKGHWVAEAAWPPADTPMLALHATPHGLMPQGAPDAAMPVLSPLTTGMASSDWCPYGLGNDMPVDQRPDDGGSLCFDSAPLERDTDMLGAALVTLEVSADKPNAMLCLRLNDVAPDGTSVRVTYGMLNLSHRDGHVDPQPLVPGKRYRVQLKLNDAGYRFAQGHRIRLAISTSYWPIAWPSPETAIVTVHTGASRLEVPVRAPKPADRRNVDFGAPEHAAPPTHSFLREPRRGRDRFEIDVATGRTKLVSIRDRGITRLPDIDLVHEGWGQDVHEITPGDPNSARTETHRRCAYERGQWKVRIDTRTELTSTSQVFRVRADIDAYEGGSRVFTRSWDVTIPRRFV